jgi:acyl carrier protein
MAVFDDVKAILIEQLAVKPEMVQLEAKLTDDLGADSLDAAEIVNTLEERFEISIADQDAATAISVGDVVELVNQKLQAKTA